MCDFHKPVVVVQIDEPYLVWRIRHLPAYSLLCYFALL